MFKCDGAGEIVVLVDFYLSRFFSCTAIGHTRDQGIYNPQGVIPPMQWLFGKADSKMAQSWTDIKFNKKVTIIDNEVIA